MSDANPEPSLPGGVGPEPAQTHLDKLVAQLPDGALLYACLRDLLENGPIGTRGTPVVSRPSRSDILHYVAKWARSVGLTEQACLEWLTAYAQDVLKAISTSSLGAIRHNAKGVVKYIYRSGYPFNCDKEKNPLQCACEPHCPLYPQAPLPLPKIGVEPALTDESGRPRILGRIKDHYREQYEKSLVVMREMHAAGHKPAEIMERLNAENLPTKTGRKWKGPVLNQTLKRLLWATPKPPEGGAACPNPSPTSTGVGDSPSLGEGE
jgi:hypothetical protein